MKRIVLGMLLWLGCVAAPLQAGHLVDVITGNMLGPNDVQLSALYSNFSLQENAGLHRYQLLIDYGITSDIDFSFQIPLVALENVESSLVIGDPEFSMVFTVSKWDSLEEMRYSSLFVYLGFLVGIGLSEGEGLTNPVTGEFQSYYPFVKGLSEFYLGAGYSTAWETFSLHANFEFFSETRGVEKTFEMNLKNDHLAFKAAVDYYTELLLGQDLSLGIKPFYETGLRIVWSSSAARPRSLVNTLGLWLRLGSLLRLRGAWSLYTALDSRSLEESRWHAELGFLFR